MKYLKHINLDIERMQKLLSEDVGIITLALSERVNVQMSVLKTLNSGQITVWTQLINPNYLFIPTTDATPHIFMLVCGTCGEQDEI